MIGNRETSVAGVDQPITCPSRIRIDRCQTSRTSEHQAALLFSLPMDLDSDGSAGIVILPDGGLAGPNPDGAPQWLMLSVLFLLPSVE
jgi:hypothetical protein